MRLTPGVGVGIAGIGLGLATFAINELALDLPHWLLVAVFVLSGALMVVGVGMEVKAHLQQPKAARSGC